MEDFKIAIGSDHGGFELKEKVIEYLKTKNLEFKDFGTFDKNSCDYPEIAQRVAKEIQNGNQNSNFNKGILICGTGIGMSIAANKIKGIRAALCSDTFSAKASRAHNDANILCLGQRVIGDCLAIEIIEAWLNSEFEGGRHQKRIDTIE